MVRGLTPEQVYGPTMAMSAARVSLAAALYRPPEALDPLTQQSFADAGEQLARMVFPAPD